MSDFDIFVPWKDEYETGCEEIDKQHKRLLYFVNELYLLAKDDSDIDRHGIKKQFDDAIEYASYHFAYEEEMMKKYGYENIKLHVEKHHFFLKEMAEQSANYEYVSKPFIMEMVLFWEAWFADHIMLEDKEMLLAIKN